MSQIFLADPDFLADADGWAVQELRSDRYRLSATPPADPGGSPPPLMPTRSGAPARRGALLLRLSGAEHGADGGWAVVTGESARLRINGELLATGIAVLRHRDELRLGAAPSFFFSAERLASVEAYPNEDHPKCPRCTQPIEFGHLSVRCPASYCGVLHHELPDRPCWTHLAACSLCSQSTDLNAGLCWSPEDV